MTMNNNEVERELGWDDTITKDSEFILLPEGEYNFKVKMYERGRFNGSEKLPPCAQATVHIEIDSPQGTVTLKNNLYLHTKTEGLLSAFFSSIGQKKKGEPLRMNWNAVTGSTGRCKVSIRNWKGNNGEDMQSNEIKRFLPKEIQSQGSGYTPGQF